MSNKAKHTENPRQTFRPERSADIPKPTPLHHHHHRDAKPVQQPLKPIYPRKMMDANIRQQRQITKSHK